jgi:F-type H+-transporting ATPase subunit delta
MIGTRATFRYAKAAVQKAIEDGQLDALAKDMDVVYNTLQNSRDLEAVLQSPIIKSELKYNLMQSVFNQFSDTSKNLLRLLAQNNRINNLDGVALKVKKLYLKHLGLAEAIATTAVPITPDLEKKILKKIVPLTNKKVSLINKVNPEIIGGFILRLDDIELNASVAHQINTLKQKFSSNAISWQN